MSRWINADALPRHGQRGGLAHWKDIDSAPSIDADRPQGEWIDAHDTDEWYGQVYKCSICGEETIGGCDNYCPNCGARMKGADDEQMD